MSRRIYKITPDIERFWKYVMPVPECGCWFWAGCTNCLGRAFFWYGKKIRYASRFAYEFFKGPIPDGMKVLHKCDIGICVNPDHLFLGTDADNARDSCEKGRHIKGETVASHKLTSDQVLEIRKDKRNKSEIAECYSIKPHTVYKIKRRLTWAHLV